MDNITTTAGLALRIGNRRAVVAIRTISDAQEYVNGMRTALELAGRGGASRFPSATIIDLTDGRTVGYISYNGRAWEGRPQDWTPSTRELR